MIQVYQDSKYQSDYPICNTWELAIGRVIILKYPDTTDISLDISLTGVNHDDMLKKWSYCFV